VAAFHTAQGKVFIVYL